MKTTWLRLLFGLPLLILAISFLDIFYIEHASGELPEDLVLTAAIAGAALLFVRPSVRLKRLTWPIATAALSVDAMILFGSCL